MGRKTKESSTGAAERARKGAADSPWAAALAPRRTDERRCWLVKSEPGTFSFEDLQRSPGRTTRWDGVRNYTARTFLRDGMKTGDAVFFYHSTTDQAIVGVAEVVREGYPDPTALDEKSPGYDAASTPESPVWFAVDLRAREALPRPVTLAEVKARADLKQMALVRVSRLSVQPVTATEWNAILTMARSAPPLSDARRGRGARE